MNGSQRSPRTAEPGLGLTCRDNLGADQRLQAGAGAVALLARLILQHKERLRRESAAAPATDSAPAGV